MSHLVFRKTPVWLAGLSSLLVIASAAMSDEIIPHATVARSTGAGIVEAFFGCPTERYPHGVLGDRIEGGCLVVTDDTGVKHTRILPEDQVFEDLTPRIADIDGDGRNDVAVILSSASEGASMAVYGIVDEKLSLTAATPYIGRSYRWLAPAAIADFNGDGKNEIAYVQTPHIGGILKFWHMQDGELKLLGSMEGVSNHSIGSQKISQSKVLDHNEDGLPDLALPNQAGTRVLVFSLLDELTQIADIPFSEGFFDESN